MAAPEQVKLKDVVTLVLEFIIVIIIYHLAEEFLSTTVALVVLVLACFGWMQLHPVAKGLMANGSAIIIAKGQRQKVMSFMIFVVTGAVLGALLFAGGWIIEIGIKPIASHLENPNPPASKPEPPTQIPTPIFKSDKVVPRNKPDKEPSATPIISLEMNLGTPPSDCPHVLFLEPAGGGISGMWIEELPRNIPSYDSHGNLYSIGPLFQKWTALNPGKDTLLNVSIFFPVVFAETQDFNKKPDGQAKLEIGALPPNAPYVFVICNRSYLWARILKPHATFDLNSTLRDKLAEVLLAGWGKSVGSGFFPPAANLTPH